MRRSERQISVVDLVETMERLGAEFYFSQAGTLFVRDLDLLPGYLRFKNLAENGNHGNQAA